MAERLLMNCMLASMQSNGQAYGFIENAAVAIDPGLISWVGPVDQLPERFRQVEQVDLGGRLVTPALIDCHTHLIFAGDRAREFEMRLNGVTYEEVAKAGGGIASTVNATRMADEATLVAEALPRLDEMIAEGVSTFEIKSSP